MNVLNSNSLKIGVNETLPFRLNYDIPAGNSVLVARHQKKEDPVQGVDVGSAAGGKQTIQFKINTDNLFDNHTARISFFHRVTTATGGSINADAKCMMDDIATSVFKKARLSMGSNQMEEIDDFNLICNAMTYYTMPRSYYEEQGGVIGAYRYNSVFDNTGTYTANSGSYNPQTAAIYGRWYQVPIYLGLFKLPQMLPPNLDMKLELELASFANSHIVISNGTGTSLPAAYKLTNVHLSYDEVQPIEAWKQAYRMALNSSTGLTLAWESFSSSPTNLATSINPVLKFQCGFQDLRSLYAIFRRSSEVDDVNCPSLSVFRRANIASYQLKIGSYTYPLNNQTQSETDMYDHTQMSWAQLNSIDAGGVVDYNSFMNADNPKLNTAFNTTAKAYSGAGSNIGTVDSGVNPENLGMKSLFLVGVNFEKSLESVWSGADTRKDGYTVDLYLRMRKSNGTEGGGTGGAAYTVTRNIPIDPLDHADETNGLNDAYNPKSSADANWSADTTSAVGPYTVNMFFHHQRVVTLKEGRIEMVQF